MTSRESGTAAAVISGLPDNSVASPEQPVSDGEAFRYFPRWVEAGDVISLNGYRLKSYSMHLSDKKEKQVLENHDLQALLQACVPPASEPLDHGPGFVIVHYARDGDYLLISRWYGGNMLKHELFRLVQNAEGWQAEPLRSTNIVACVWELQVIAFERQAWVATAMAKRGTERSFKSYLNTVLEGWV
jgi:hypothetical protein